MSPQIDEYSVLEFANFADYADFERRLLTFVGSKPGFGYMAGEPRAVVWSETVGLEGQAGRLYLSDAALQAAREAGLEFEVARTITKDELPANRSLVLGDQRDWDERADVTIGTGDLQLVTSGSFLTFSSEVETVQDIQYRGDVLRIVYEFPSGEGAEKKVEISVDSGDTLRLRFINFEALADSIIGPVRFGALAGHPFQIAYRIVSLPGTESKQVFYYVYVERGGFDA